MSTKKRYQGKIDLRHGTEGADSAPETKSTQELESGSPSARHLLGNPRIGFTGSPASIFGNQNSGDHIARSTRNTPTTILALISMDGQIIDVNEAWRNFAEQDCSFQPHFVGANYFDTCRVAAAAGDAFAQQALDGLLAIVNNTSSAFEFEYPCESANQPRWFLMRANRSLRDPSLLLLMHIDLTAHKNLEESLKKSRAMFAKIFDVTPAIMGIANLAESRFVAVNAAFERKLGWMRDEAIGRSSLELNFWDSPEDYQRTKDAILNAGRMNDWECRIRTKSGTPLVGLLSAQRVKIDQSDCVILVFDDISAQREIQERLWESERKYHTTVEMAPDAFYVLDESGKICEVNESACAQLRYSREQLLTLQLDDIVPTKNRETARKRIGELTDAGAFYETQHVRSDGTELSVELNVRKTIINGRPAVLGVARDITERRLAQEALKASESKYRRLHESMADGFVLVDLAGRIQEFNASYAAILGYENRELAQLTYLELTPTKWQAMEKEIVRTQVLPRGYSDVYEKEYRRKDGTIFPVELRTFLLKNDQNENEGMWAIVRDITRRTTAETHLKKANEQLNALNDKLTEEHALLQDKHTALREVLQHIDDEKNEIRVNISENVTKIIAPLVRNLRSSIGKNQSQAKLLTRLEKALDDVTSPFISHLAGKFDTLTPREIQVCGMVKDGLASKEIAEYLGISVLTVNKLRQQIRHKLGIDNKDVGLSEYLRTL